MADSRVKPRPEKQYEQRLATMAQEIRRLKARVGTGGGGGGVSTDHFFYDTLTAVVGQTYTVDGGGTLNDLVDLADPGGGSGYSVPGDFTVEPGVAATDGLYVPPGLYAATWLSTFDTDLTTAQASSITMFSVSSTTDVPQAAYLNVINVFSAGYLAGSAALTSRLYEHAGGAHATLGLIQFRLSSTGLTPSTNITAYHTITVSRIG